jgi:hypothetical protein
VSWCVNLLGLVFVVIHILATLLDSYVHVGIAAVFVPFVSHYRAIGVAWGTLAFDLFLLIAATGVLRIRMREPIWRWIHTTAYLAWPLALVDFISTGTDGAYALGSADSSPRRSDQRVPPRRLTRGRPDVRAGVFLSPTRLDVDLGAHDDGVFVGQAEVFGLVGGVVGEGHE